MIWNSRFIQSPRSHLTQLDSSFQHNLTSGERLVKSMGFLRTTPDQTVTFQTVRRSHYVCLKEQPRTRKEHCLVVKRLLLCETWGTTTRGYNSNWLKANPTNINLGETFKGTSLHHQSDHDLGWVVIGTSH